jgi:hypothetical protein
MTRLSTVFNYVSKADARVRSGSLSAKTIFAKGGVLLALLLAISPSSQAQISQGNGNLSQENRTSSMGTAPESQASAVHESLKPQSKDAVGNARGPTAGKGHKTEGAGGFNNGLYGTGAGGNK